MKNLIYYSLGFNLIYVDIFLLNLSTLEKYNDGSFDILIICDERTKSELDNKLKTNLKINYHVIKSLSPKNSSLNKLKIYEYQDLKLYDKVIFCDCDTLWYNTPNTVFERTIENKITFSHEVGSLILGTYWGEKLITEKERYIISKERIGGVNAGFFSFFSNMSFVFKEIEIFLNTNLNRINLGWEQPFINVYCYRNNLISYNLTDIVKHNISISDKPNYTLVHFSGSPGAGRGKLIKMQKFLENNGIKL